MKNNSNEAGVNTLINLILGCIAEDSKTGELIRILNSFSAIIVLYDDKNQVSLLPTSIVNNIGSIYKACCFIVHNLVKRRVDKKHDVGDAKEDDEEDDE